MFTCPEPLGKLYAEAENSKSQQTDPGSGALRSDMSAIIVKMIHKQLLYSTLSETGCRVSENGNHPAQLAVKPSSVKHRTGSLLRLLHTFQKTKTYFCPNRETGQQFTGF